MGVKAHARRGAGSDRARVVTGVTTILILLVLLGSTLGAPLAKTPDRDFDQPDRTLRSSSSTLGPDIPRPTLPENPHTETPTWLFAVIGTVLLAAAAMIAWLVLRWLLDTVRARRRDGAPPPTPIPPEAAAASLLEDSRLHWEALAEGKPSEAVIAMWVALERSVARAGVERAPSETSGELTLRVLDRLTVDGDAVETLAHLYREARFSRHRLTDEQREHARAALAQVHASLARIRPRAKEEP